MTNVEREHTKVKLKRLKSPTTPLVIIFSLTTLVVNRTMYFVFLFLGGISYNYHIQQNI